MSGRFVVVPAAYVYLLRPGPYPGAREVLLGLRSNTGYMDGYWASAIAGHVESGESVYDAAAREAAEETGIRDVRLVPWCAMQRTGGTGDPIDERVDYFFTATAWSGVPQVMEPEKCAEARWCLLDALPSPVVPHELRVLSSIRAGSTPPIIMHGF